jgi:hypothetical protein
MEQEGVGSVNKSARYRHGPNKLLETSQEIFQLSSRNDHQVIVVNKTLNQQLNGIGTPFVGDGYETYRSQ